MRWVLAALAIALGAWLLVRRVRKKAPPPELTEAERRRAAQLLE